MVHPNESEMRTENAVDEGKKLTGPEEEEEEFDSTEYRVHTTDGFYCDYDSTWETDPNEESPPSRIRQSTNSNYVSKPVPVTSTLIFHVCSQIIYCRHKRSHLSQAHRPKVLDGPSRELYSGDSSVHISWFFLQEKNHKDGSKKQQKAKERHLKFPKRD